MEVEQENYYWRSLKQFFLGDYTDDVTLLGTGASVAAGFIGLDVAADVRDISANVYNWDNSWSSWGSLGLNVAGLVPIIGAFKYADEGAEVAQGTRKSAITVGDANASLPKSQSIDFAETGALGGKLFPQDKIPGLVKYLDRRGVWLKEGANSSFDGVRGIMTLPRNPTILQVKHELSHFLDYQKYGDHYYKRFSSFEREEMVLDRLMGNRFWNTLSDHEQEWSILYPFTRHKGGY